MDRGKANQDIGRPDRGQLLPHIIYRYGYPNSIITDNGTNFAKGAFAQFCGNNGIRLDLASVVHPQTNGQVEKANGLILAGIKPRLMDPSSGQPSAG